LAMRRSNTQHTKVDQTNKLLDVHLMVVLNHGSTLASWDQAGIYEREMAVYRRLSKRLRQISLVTWSKGDDEEYKEDLAPIQVIYNEKAWRARIWKMIFWWQFPQYKAKNLVLKTNQMPGADWVASLAQRVDAPLIARCGYMWSLNAKRSDGENSAQARKALATEKKAFDYADQIVMTCPTMRDYIVETHHVSGEKINIVPNYIDTALFFPDQLPVPQYDVDNTPLRLLAISRLTAHKNVSVLLEAAARCGDFIIDIVGDGQERNELHELANKLNLDVTFHGILPHAQLPDLMRRADIYALPSFYEGHPKTLIEAMACGCAVLGSDVPGIREVIDDGRNGLLREPSVDGFRDGLASLQKQAVRRRLGGAAAKFAHERYALDHYVDRITEIIKNTIRT